jgi:AcrR family transcriptional regulator
MLISARGVFSQGEGMALTTEKSRREEYADATRQALLAAARELFTTNGYEATGIEDVSKAARVTRGALYHHFEDKRALFDALVMELWEETERYVQEQVRAVTEPDKWKRLEIGIGYYLDTCSRPAYRRLVIQDAPAVLGMKRFRELDQQYNQRLLARPFAALKKSGELDFGDAELFGHLVGGIVWEAAMLESKNPKLLRKGTLEFVRRMLSAFRASQPQTRALSGAGVK